MPDETSLLNIGDLSKPATVLIERISDAVGGIFKPWQTKRVAQAEAEAEKIRALAKIEITELQQRALERFVVEEEIKQKNIESITAKAVPQLEETATPQDIENDWIANFFDKSRLISDEEMQDLWARVLAGEANAPGTYSKRTVNALSSLDKSDALLFQKLCNFGWFLGKLYPLIYDTRATIYTNHGISFASIKHLDAIGLISYENVGSYSLIELPKKINVTYYGTPINIEFEKEEQNELSVGYVMLTKVGQELAPICGSNPIPEFFDYTIEHWAKKMELCISTPIKVTLPK